MSKKKINIITGKKHSGKTTFLLKQIDELRGQGIAVGGLVSIGSFKDHSRYDFKLMDVSTCKKEDFLSRKECKPCDKIGRFYINPKAIDFGVEVLKNCIKNNLQTIVLDEIGPLELNNKGWAVTLPELIASGSDLILVVRKNLLGEVLSKWNIACDQFTEIE